MSIFRVKATLKNIKPSIWRRIELSKGTTLKQFHRVLQIAFGWQDYHLHAFIVGKLRFGVSDPSDFGEPVIPERSVQLAKAFSAPGQKIKYLYDFGDGWEVVILLESIVDAEPGVQYPRVTAGARSGPPEDSGGPYGYGDLLEILADASHERFEEMQEWAGSGFKPEEFSTGALNSRLRRNGSLAVKARK